jgi:hypothetical protein
MLDFMKKMRSGQSVRARQKMSMKMVVFASVYCLAVITIGIIITINLSHIEKSMAQAVAKYTIEDESFVTDKSLPTTVSKQHPLFGPQTQFVRKVKQINTKDTNLSE